MKISDIFNIYSEDHRFTEEFLYRNKGIYPVYSATLNDIYGYTNEYAYDEKMILVVNYGDAGKTRVVNGKFSIGRNICGLTIKGKYKNNFNLEYMSIVLQKALTEEVNQGNMGCLSINSIKNIDVQEPEISIGEQKTIIEKINKVRDIQIKLNKEKIKIQEILSHELKINKFIKLNMSEIALLNKGSNKINEENIYRFYKKNGIPIYSSATQNDGLMGMVNEKFYDSIDKKGNEKELTWTTNGYAGKVFYRNKKYLYSEKCGRIVLKDKYKKVIDNKYLMYYLNQITYKYKTSESNNGKLDIIHMSNIPIKIPINEKGKIYLKEQEKIANMYEYLYLLQKKLEILCKKIEEVLTN